MSASPASAPGFETESPTPARPSVFRETGNVHARLPLSSLESFPDNPKKPISGKYKRGLEANLEEFGICDVLKCWPDPRNKNRYYVLDGNQRLGLLREKAEEELGLKDVAEDDPDRDAKLADIRSLANSFQVDCLILAELDRERALIFNAAFDRNHAAYDEGKLADLAERLAGRREDLSAELAEKRAALEKRLGKILRPERPFIAPVAFTPSSATTLAPMGPDGSPVATSFDPTSDEPWGPPPPDLESESSPAVQARERFNRPRETLIPYMLSVTPASKAALDINLLRCKARGIREKRVVEASEQFARSLAEARDDDAYTEAFLEMALRVLNDRIVILKASEDVT